MFHTIERPNGSKRVLTVPQGETMTEQHHKKRHDVNRIIAKYKKTGIIDQQMKNGFYGDFTGSQDFQHAVNRINDANNDFAMLPSHIRERFSNSPAYLLDFISNNDNYSEAIALGLVKKAEEKPDTTPIVEPEPA